MPSNKTKDDINNELLKNEEHFQSLLQNSSDAITIIDKKGIITFESSHRNKISDFTANELIGKPIFDIVHPDEKEEFVKTFIEVLKNPKKQVKKEYRSLHKNKKWIYVESILSNHLKNPSIQGIVVNSRDISDRKMSDLKEKAYHDNLIFLSNSALDLLSIADREDMFKYIAEKLYNFLENAIVFVNSYDDENNEFTINYVSGLNKYQNQIMNILGIDLIGLKFPIDRNIANITNAGSIITLKDEFWKLNFGKLQRKSIESGFKLIKVNKIYSISLARHNKLLGNIAILTLNKSIIKFKHIIETFVHQVSVALHRSHLEYELIKARDKAEESDKLKTAFLANMSHEIRTPMNGILGFAEMLNDDKLSYINRKKYLDIINSNGKMLINLIDDIIDFAKIEAGQVKLLEHDFSLNNLLKQINASFLSESLKKEKGEVKLKVRKSLPDNESFIRTDPNRLRQILINLIGNAFKFIKKGYIEYGYQLSDDNKQLEFYVKDTGIGIPQEKLRLIFDRFIQADSSRSRKYSGSGLGLPISRGFVELLGGKMWVESEIDKGSIFHFTIPYIPGEKPKKAEIQQKKPRKIYNWEGKTFLIAEDDKFSFKFLEGFLAQTKAKILHAADGNMAVEICRKNKNLDVILMDIQMPDMNGIEATTIIRKFNKKIPILAQTANAILEEKQKCFEAGFNDFITKPINITELYTKIDQWLSAK